LHAPRTTVAEQVGIVVGLLHQAGRASFRELSADCQDTYEIVARFLAVLDLYRDRCVTFEQEVPLGELFITWTDDLMAVSPDNDRRT
jgi:segregation and condensation protein A